MKNIWPILLIFGFIAFAEDFPCNPNPKNQNAGDTLETRIECDIYPNMKFVAQYKNNIQNGFSMSFRKYGSSKSEWIRYDSSFYINGKQNGLSLVWDSLGGISSKAFHKNGKPIGKRENFYVSGKPCLTVNYNDSGNSEGPELHWWPNGNKSLVAENKNGQMIYSEEYFPNGQLRLRSRDKYLQDINKEQDMHISFETFSPKGKPTGKVVNGNGETWMFEDEPDPELKRYRVLHEVFKDSVKVSNEEVSAEVVKKLLK